MKTTNQTHRTKFIFITGGVLSSLGKGLAAASIGALLESRGLSITFQKLDPYINVDPGTMNPFQHGEVYVTDDGAETDLDLGHYERYTSVALGQRNNYTSGRIYHSVISKERRGEYLGGTVQVIPHVTDEIKRAILQFEGEVDVAIIEIGGTIGDIEGLPFLEAIRQFRTDVGKENSLYIHVTWVPYIKTAGEVKTKPTQHSVKELRAIGIQPDILLCRTESLLSNELKAKISLFCNVEKEAVITPAMWTTSTRCRSVSTPRGSTTSSSTSSISGPERRVLMPGRSWSIRSSTRNARWKSASSANMLI